MVKFYESNFNYDYAFPTVTLAYFLRYPNPYSRHVLSTDVIDRYVDPHTQRLHTLRLHLKRSKIPSTLLKLLPRGIIGSVKGNAGQSFILEKSVVDLREGWMETESRNLEWTGVLSVIEKQKFSRPTSNDQAALSAASNAEFPSSVDEEGRTDVNTTVILLSRLGQAKMFRAKNTATGALPASHGHGSEDENEPPVKKGLLSSWSMSSIQRSIEMIGVKRTRDHVVKSSEGMKLVLERLRNGGLVAVLEGMRRDAATYDEGGGS